MSAAPDRFEAVLDTLVNADGSFAAAFDQTEVGFFLASPAGRLVRVNQALSELVGLSKEELCGRPLADLVDSADRAETASALARFVEGKLGRFDGELRLLGGGRRGSVWVEAGITAVPDATGGIQALIGQVRDITSRRQTEDALRESEQLFRTAFDDAAVGMLLVSPEGTIVRSNSALHRLLGYGDDELYGMHAIELCHPDDRVESQTVMPKFRSGEMRRFSTEKRCVRKDGEAVWVEVDVATVWMPSGELRCYVTQVIDLTARRKAEQKFRMVFDAAGIGISTGAGGMLSETNPAYQQLLGYTADELSHMHYSEITHPDDVDIDSHLMAELLAGRESSFKVDKRLVRRDGATVWVRVTVTMAPDRSFGIGLIEDITERRQLLVRTVEAAESERIALAADLHDGPIQHLTAAAFKLDLLANTLARDGQDAAVAIARQARDDVAAEMTSLRQMMTELRPPIIDERGIDAALRDCIHTLMAAGETDCTIESNLDRTRLRPQCETALYRIVYEALTNIRKHAHAAHAHIAVDARDATIHLTITDDGIGFNPAAAGGHHGLITMRERVESLGGSLNYTATPGTGTHLQATIPRSVARAAHGLASDDPAA